MQSSERGRHTHVVQVIEALVNVGKRLGVDYRLSTPISSIEISADGSHATGVKLVSGEVLNADIVVNNTDLVYAYNNLLPATSYAHSLSQRPASCSSISFYWALDRKVPELTAHNIFLADDYQDSFDNIFKRHLIPDEPSFYVNVPSRIDPTAAPEGKDSIVVLVPVGHLLETSDTNANDAAAAKANGSLNSANGGIKPSEHQDWPAMTALARKTIVQTIKSRIGVDLDPLIIHEESNDPASWRDRFNLDKGAILGLSHSFFNVLSFRPSTRARRGGWLDGKLGGGIAARVGELLGDIGRSTRNIQGLYMVGASSHPGTGVPICLAGGRLVAEQVLEDLSIDVPWRREGEKAAEKEIDRVKVPGVRGMNPWMRFAVGFLEVFLVLALIVWLAKSMADHTASTFKARQSMYSP